MSHQMSPSHMMTPMPMSSMPTQMPMSSSPMSSTPMSLIPMTSTSTRFPFQSSMSSHIPTLSSSTQMPMSSMSMSMPMSMSMVMTFGDWGDYQLQLIFDSWTIKTKTQYFFSWIFIVFAVVCWHGLKYIQSTIIEGSIRKGSLNSRSDSHDDIEYTTINFKLKAKKQNSSSVQVLHSNPSEQFERRWMLRLTHSLISAASYGLALLLMLVSMTYNCGLFLALVIGYFIGDLLFFRYNHASLRNYETEDQCH